MFGLYGLRHFFSRKVEPIRVNKKEAKVQACFQDLKEKGVHVVETMAKHASNKMGEKLAQKVSAKPGEILDSPLGQTLVGVVSSRFMQFMGQHVVNDELQKATVGKVQSKYEEYVKGKSPEAAAEAIVAELAPDIDKLVRSPRSEFSQSMVDFAESVLKNLPTILDDMPAKERVETAHSIKVFFDCLSENLHQLAEKEGEVTGEEVGELFANALKESFPTASELLMGFMGKCIAEMRLKKELLEGPSVETMSNVVTDDPSKARVVQNDIELFKSEIASIFSNLTKEALNECAHMIDQKVFAEKIPYFRCTFAQFLESPWKQWLAKKLLGTKWAQKKIHDKLNPKIESEEQIQRKIAQITTIAKKIVARMVASLPSQTTVKENLARLKRDVEVFSLSASTSSYHRGQVIAAAADAAKEISALPKAFQERAANGETLHVGEMLEELRAPVDSFVKKATARPTNDQSWGSWFKSCLGY